MQQDKPAGEREGRVLAYQPRRCFKKGVGAVLRHYGGLLGPLQVDWGLDRVQAC